MTEQQIKESIREVPDFPKEGILFYDITTALAKPCCLQWFKKKIADYYKGKGITKVLGIESRGFIMGSIAALDLNAGFVPIRKPGKLPYNTIAESYDKEYGVDTIEIHADAVNKDDIVLIHDDLLATGGTIAAAIRLVQKMGVKKIYVNTLIELDDLKGRELIGPKIDVYSLIHY